MHDFKSLTYIQTDIHTYRQNYRQSDRLILTHKDIQTDIQTDLQSQIQNEGNEALLNTLKSSYYELISYFCLRFIQ